MICVVEDLPINTKGLLIKYAEERQLFGVGHFIEMEYVLAQSVPENENEQLQF